jgi:hypothetical protein
MSLDTYNNETLGNGSPSALDAQNDKVKTAINVLEAEAEHEGNEFDAELLDAAARKLKAEVLH